MAVIESGDHPLDTTDTIAATFRPLRMTADVRSQWEWLMSCEILWTEQDNERLRYAYEVLGKTTGEIQEMFDSQAPLCMF